MKIYLQTYGCTFNQADTQIMGALLEEEGFFLVDSEEEADLLIINTCYVKKPTEQKIINRIKSLEDLYPHKNIIVAGCMVDIDPERLNSISRTANWLGAHQVLRVVDAVHNIEQGNIIRWYGHSSAIKAGVLKNRSNPFVHILQICEGCSGVCSYCCTRFARGSLQSYPLSILKEEANKALEDGVVELQLTAQDTAAYGKDIGTNLSHLLQELSSLSGNFKMRVGMMHPGHLLNDLEGTIDAFRSDKIYKFLHLPLQSGNDNVLKDMKRGYSSDDFLDIVKSFKYEIPDLCLATDVIVGYPTEDEDAFQDTMDVIQKVRPDFLHISKYHHRPGATSSALNELDVAIMKQRTRRLNEAKRKIAFDNNLHLLNTSQNVLVTDEGPKGGYLGRTDSYKTVILDHAQPGNFYKVKITQAFTTYLRAELI